MDERQVVIAGGGAAGFFAAIACAETCPSTRVLLVEKGSRFLSKVRISGGGRCNVTHACFDPDLLSTFYPRGGAALRGAFRRFQPRDTMEWFERRGVRLKIEQDNRVFPITDSSQTIIDCLLAGARDAGVELEANRGVARVDRTNDARFVVKLEDGRSVGCDSLMLATGGCRSSSMGSLAAELGHTIEPPVPSLFTFEIPASWLRTLAGISLEEVELSVPGTGLHERGPMLITHAGLSGPAILRLSAWGARDLHKLNYQFALRVNWLPKFKAEQLVQLCQSRRAAQASRLLSNSPISPLAARLWEQLVEQAGIRRETRWADLSHSSRHRLIEQLGRTELQVRSKSLNRDEFVTCGGVRLGEVNFKTMESRLCPGLYFGGELLDIDGVTGGFNFQAAWTTGWLAGHALGARERGP